MQIFEKPNKKKRLLKSTKVATSQPEEEIKEHKRKDENAVCIDTKAGVKQSVDSKEAESSSADNEALSKVASWLAVVGTGLAGSAHTAATACRAASTNPYMLAAGVVLTGIGIASAIYFKFFS